MPHFSRFSQGISIANCFLPERNQRSCLCSALQEEVLQASVSVGVCHCRAEALRPEDSAAVALYVNSHCPRWLLSCEFLVFESKCLLML